jgi:predicted XRE-type DNA-binding protein
MKRRVIRSSGNVFADIGVPNAAEHNIKAEVVLRIAALIERQRLSQSEVSKLIKLAQPDVSKLLRGHFSGYSLERLFGYLNALGQTVTIDVKEAKSKKDARVELLEMAL